MANLAVWLLALAWPLAKKVLLALGIGWATYEGLSVLASGVSAQVISAWGQLGGTTLQLLSLGGWPQAVGILLGALTARAALLATAKLTKVTQ